MGRQQLKSFVRFKPSRVRCITDNEFVQYLYSPYPDNWPSGFWLIQPTFSHGRMGESSARLGNPCAGPSACAESLQFDSFATKELITWQQQKSVKR
jgi:hypothetical protein